MGLRIRTGRILWMVAAAFATVQPGPAAAQNPKFVREFIGESRAILTDVDAVRKQWEASLGEPTRPEQVRQVDPAAAAEQFQRNVGPTMEKFGGRVKRLMDLRQRAEKTLSPREAQFTAEVQGDLLGVMRRLALSQMLVADPPARRGAYFEDLGRQTEAVRKKLQAYQQ